MHLGFISSSVMTASRASPSQLTSTLDSALPTGPHALSSVAQHRPALSNNLWHSLAWSNLFNLSSTDHYRPEALIFLRHRVAGARVGIVSLAQQKPGWKLALANIVMRNRLWNVLSNSYGGEDLSHACSRNAILVWAFPCCNRL